MICIDENRSVADSSPGHLPATRPPLLTAPPGARRAPAGTAAGVARWVGFWWWKLGQGHGLEKPLLAVGLRRGSCQTPHGPGAAGPTASPRAATLSPAPGAEAICAARPRAGEPEPPRDARSGCRHRDAHLPPPASHFPPWPGPRPTLTFLRGYQRPHAAQDAGFVARAGAGWVIGLHSGGVGHVPVGFSEPALPRRELGSIRSLVGWGGGRGWWCWVLFFVLVSPLTSQRAQPARRSRDPRALHRVAPLIHSPSFREERIAGRLQSF